MTNALVALNELERMAAAFAKSGMFGAKTTEQAMALLLLAQGEGLHPAIAMRDFDIIQGRPAKKAEAMLRSFIAAGGKVEWHTMTDEKADATFSHENGGTVRIDWDMARAKRAGVGMKDNYNKYPRQMLANRVISEGCRRVYPASTSGLYVPEEVIQFKGEKDITPTAGYFAALPDKRQEILLETARQINEYMAKDQIIDAHALTVDEGLEAEEKIALWSLLDSRYRSTLKKYGESQRQAEAGTISPAQKKRLEALIKESKLDREGLKNWCSMKFSKGHFAELTADEYKELDAHIASLMPALAPSPANPPAAPPSAARADGATITEAQESAILDLLELHGKSIAQFLARAKVKRIIDLQADRFDGAVKWIKGD